MSAIQPVLCAGALLLVGSVAARSQESRAPERFAELGLAYRAAEAAHNTEQAGRILQRIRELRIERNVRSLTSLSLMFVDIGMSRLEAGESDAARDALQTAVALDPRLPDAHFALTRWYIKHGPLGLFGAMRSTVSGWRAGLATSRGQAAFYALVAFVLFSNIVALAGVLALTTALRYAGLVRHDFEEILGMEGGRGWALGLTIASLFVPLLLFQGYAWLPLWCLAFLFIYFRKIEKILSVAVLLSLASMIPAMRLLENRLKIEVNPLYQASLNAIDGEGDPSDIALLEKARAEAPDDRDLGYLLAAQYKKVGRYDRATNVLRGMLGLNGSDTIVVRDAIAVNNLATIAFAGGAWPEAIDRFKQGQSFEGSNEVKGTIAYNLSLAFLQSFQYQNQKQERDRAEGLARHLLGKYEGAWRVVKAGTTVYGTADLGPTPEELRAKYSAAYEGDVRRNVTGSGASWIPIIPMAKSTGNRITAFVGLFFIVVVARSKWRGRRAFTTRCLKCGTIFCRRCHLGATIGGLCTQCQHLFLVRDGVSGPARNQKMLAVQDEEARRERIYRLLSLLSPGAGHMYAQRVLAGAGLVLIWYGIILSTVYCNRVIPLTDAPGWLVGPTSLIAAVVLLVALYIVVNRSKPEFESVMPARRAAFKGRRR